MCSHPPELKTDVQILHDDRAAFELFIQGILANKRLAWEIVSAWLDLHHKLLVDRPGEKQELFMGLWPDLLPKERAAVLAVAEALVEEA